MDILGKKAKKKEGKFKTLKPGKKGYKFRGGSSKKGKPEGTQLRNLGNEPQKRGRK